MKADNAIILLAGEGTRLLPLTASMPKCFVTVRNITVLENALQKFAEIGVRNVHLVIGHLGEVVREKIGSQAFGMHVNYIVNAIYRSTNSMFSLLLALRQVSQPVWVLEGDIFLDREILDVEPATPGEIVWFGDSTIKDVDGAFLLADESGAVAHLDIIRDLSRLTPAHHKSVGMLHLTAAGRDRLLDWLETGLREEKQNFYYDLIVAEHLGEGGISLVDVGGRRWFEIDTPQDLERARAIFA